jgi:hypothetical protein
MARLTSTVALLVPVLVCACGGDDGGGGKASATGTGITSAGVIPGLATDDPSGTTSDTGGLELSGGATDDSATSEPKLDLGAHDFGGPVAVGCTSIDVLFVVDISGSMKEEKANLNANFPNFVAVLDAYVADPGNTAAGYRLGVTNSAIVDNTHGKSSMGLDGALFDGDNLFDDDCELGGDLWIDGPGHDVAELFTCLAAKPKASCNVCTDLGLERPLDAIERFIAKSAPGGVNDGFYRGEDALFVVVILTDEDDDPANTTTTPAKTRAALDAFTGGDERYVVVTIAGPRDGPCDSAFGSATAAPTLHAFTELVKNGLMGDICQGDLAQPLSEALALIQSSCDALPPPVG